MHSSWFYMVLQNNKIFIPFYTKEKFYMKMYLIYFKVDMKHHE